MMHENLKYLAIALIAFFLSSCAANSVTNLKEGASQSVSFEVADNYQHVYKTLLGKFYECIGEGWAGVFAMYHVRHELYNELGEAEISFLMTNLSYPSYYFHVDIGAALPDKTQVTAYAYYSAWKSLLARVEQWGRHPESGCAAEKQASE